MTTIDARPSADGKGLSFKVSDRPDRPDMDAARAIREAVAAIERSFLDGADWRRVVGALHLMLRILEEPPRTCRRCRHPFTLEHGAAFALYHRGLPLPKHCAACRALRRRERTAVLGDDPDRPRRPQGDDMPGAE